MSSRVLQGQLKQIASQPTLLDEFSNHLKNRGRLYIASHVLLALQGLSSEVLPREEVVEKKGEKARSAVINKSHAPILQGLNFLMWEHAIRKGDFTTLEKKRVRELYLAHARNYLFQRTGDQEKDFAAQSRLESQFDQAVIAVAGLPRFDHIRDIAGKIHRAFKTDLEVRRDTPHRAVLNDALNTFDRLLSHLTDYHDIQRNLL